MRPIWSILFMAVCQFSVAVLPLTAAHEPASQLVIQRADPDPEPIRRYLRSASIRRAGIEGTEMEVEITAMLPKLQKAAALRALRRVSCDGRVTYQALDFSGDLRVKREVIARYLTAETEVRDAGSIAITPDNYEFRLKTTVGLEGQTVHIYRLKPRKRTVGLFKGELWLDADTGMPLRESGQFVKLPSIFIKRIRFVRDYQIRGGVSIPKSIASTVETRLAGRAELKIQYQPLTDTSPGACSPADLAGDASSGHEH